MTIKASNKSLRVAGILAVAVAIGFAAAKLIPDSRLTHKVEIFFPVIEILLLTIMLLGQSREITSLKAQLDETKK